MSGCGTAQTDSQVVLNFSSCSSGVPSTDLATSDCRNIVSCMGLARLAPSHPGLPSGYEHPAWGIVLELCKVRESSLIGFEVTLVCDHTK